MSIIPATPADISSLVLLVNSAYRGGNDHQGWTQESHLIAGARTNAADLEQLLQTPNAVILKYLENDTILGCVFLEIKANKLYLGLLSVLPNKQNAGIGKKLLAAADEYAGSHHCTHIQITVIEARPELVAWYERHGYIRTGEIQPFHAGEKFGIAKQKIELLVLEKPV